MLPLEPTPYSKDYEITDAMFGAFRTSGGMQFFWKLFGWSTLLLTIIGALLIPPTLSAYVELIKASVMVESNPDSAFEALVIMAKFVGMIGLYMFGYIVVIAIIRAAFYRGYFFGELGGTFPFQFGRDELRQGLAILGFYVLLMVLLFGVTIVTMTPMTFLIMALGEDSVLFMVLIMILLYLGIIVVYIWFGVRFCTAGALTALRGKTHLLAARHISRNRFWALFGSILVAGLIGYVVSNIAYTTGFLMAFSGLNINDLITVMSGSDPEVILAAIERATATASFRISTFIAIAVVSAGYAFYSLILAGPQAFFTRQWADAAALNLEPTYSE
ncbi:MAG: hypothetical protein ACSHX3_06115 [Litorimonas sp.]